MAKILDVFYRRYSYRLQQYYHFVVNMTIIDNKNIFYKVFQHYKVCQTNTQVSET